MLAAMFWGQEESGNFLEELSSARVSSNVLALIVNHEEEKMLEKYANLLQEDAAKSTAQVTNARKVLEIAANMCDEMHKEHEHEDNSELLLQVAANLRALTRMIL